MRDLSTEELTHVYGAGGKGKSCPPPKYKPCKGGRGKGGSSKSYRCGKGGSS